MPVDEEGRELSAPWDGPSRPAVCPSCQAGRRTPGPRIPHRPAAFSDELRHAPRPQTAFSPPEDTRPPAGRADQKCYRFFRPPRFEQLHHPGRALSPVPMASRSSAPRLHVRPVPADRISRREGPRSHMTTTAAAPAETSFPKSQIRVLLLENVHASAHEIFRQEGFQVETCAGALAEGRARREGPRRARPRDPEPDPGHRPGALRGPPPAHARRLLHRHEPGGPRGRQPSAGFPSSTRRSATPAASRSW